MSRLQRGFPDTARFYREEDGELFMSWIGDPPPGVEPGQVMYHEPVQIWMDEHTIDGTTYDAIETTEGEIISVVLSPPGGGISAGPVASRRFRLVRHEDVSGVSGTGVVAHGVQMPDGFVALRWCVPGMPATWNLLEAVEHVELLNGHRGKTEVEWID